MEDRWKVTIIFYHGKPEVHRNQTDKQVTEHERRHLKNMSTIKNVRVEREPRLRIVKDAK